MAYYKGLPNNPKTGSMREKLYDYFKKEYDKQSDKKKKKDKK